LIALCKSYFNITLEVPLLGAPAFGGGRAKGTLGNVNNVMIHAPLMSYNQKNTIKNKMELKKISNPFYFKLGFPNFEGLKVGRAIRCQN